MPTLLTADTAICAEDPPWSPDEAQVAAAAFLARYNGRTLEAYRHDLRYYVQWAADHTLRCSTRREPTSRSTALRWNNAGLRRRRSIGGCRRCAATTASPHRRSHRVQSSPVRASTRGRTD